MHRAALALALLAVAAFAAEESSAATDPAPAADDPNAGTWLESLTDWLPDMSTITGTRGERNNNPGNIRLGNNWQGEAAGTDAAFETFATPQDGIRALAKLLRNYQVKYGLNTVRAIIGRYAPSSENNTAAYVAAVAADMGVSADAALNLADAGTLQALTAAVIHHENGRNIYSSAQIASAVALA